MRPFTTPTSFGCLGNIVYLPFSQIPIWFLGVFVSLFYLSVPLLNACLYFCVYYSPFARSFFLTLFLRMCRTDSTVSNRMAQPTASVCVCVYIWPSVVIFHIQYLLMLCSFTFGRNNKQTTIEVYKCICQRMKTSRLSSYSRYFLFIFMPGFVFLASITPIGKYGLC